MEKISKEGFVANDDFAGSAPDSPDVTEVKPAQAASPAFVSAFRFEASDGGSYNFDAGSDACAREHLLHAQRAGWVDFGGVLYRRVDGALLPIAASTAEVQFSAMAFSPAMRISCARLARRAQRTAQALTPEDCLAQLPPLLALMREVMTFCFLRSDVEQISNHSGFFPSSDRGTDDS